MQVVKNYTIVIMSNNFYSTHASNGPVCFVAKSKINLNFVIHNRGIAV